LSQKKLGSRAEILQPGIPVREAFESEVVELDKAAKMENEAATAMEWKRAEEIERGRVEIMEHRYRESLEVEESVIETGPVCTRIPRLLAISNNASLRIATSS
jgi:hypothetical protein